MTFSMSSFLPFRDFFLLSNVETINPPTLPTSSLLLSLVGCHLHESRDLASLGYVFLRLRIMPAGDCY